MKTAISIILLSLFIHANSQVLSDPVYYQNLDSANQLKFKRSEYSKSVRGTVYKLQDSLLIINGFEVGYLEFCYSDSSYSIIIARKGGFCLGQYAVFIIVKKGQYIVLSKNDQSYKLLKKKLKNDKELSRHSRKHLKNRIKNGFKYEPDDCPQSGHVNIEW